MSVHYQAVSGFGRGGHQETKKGYVLASLVVGLRGREALHLVSTTVQSNRWFQVCSEINYPAVVLGHEFWKRYSV